MNKYSKAMALSLFLVAPSVMAFQSDFCPSSQCTPVWHMAGATPGYDNHGQGWIANNPATNIQYDSKNGVMVVKYNHSKPGDVEHTSYVSFELFNPLAAPHPEFRQHGFLTATITVTGTQSPAELKNRIWPAFWLCGPAWPTQGEIDMAEYMGTVQNLTTNTNLHGGPAKSNRPRPYAVRYNVSGLGDIGVPHIYGVEWEKVNNGYWLRIYFDNALKGQTFLSSNSATYPDVAIIRGLTDTHGNAMRLRFDTDDVGSLGGDGAARGQPALNYQMKIENVQAYSVK